MSQGSVLAGLGRQLGYQVLVHVDTISVVAAEAEERWNNVL